MREASTIVKPLKDSVNKWVMPDGNHHIAIYEDEAGKLYEEVITFWDAVERLKQKIFLFAPQDQYGRKLVSA